MEQVYVPGQQEDNLLSVGRLCDQQGLIRVMLRPLSYRSLRFSCLGRKVESDVVSKIVILFRLLIPGMYVILAMGDIRAYQCLAF